MYSRNFLLIIKLYVLPYGQMSLWGATVITNLMSAIPWIGQDIVEFIWGGFSVNNATLNRFFSLHFVLPFVLAALVLMHLIVLHDVAGSGNPLGVSGNYERIPMAPYYLFKDLITIFAFIFVLSLFVFFMPNVLGDSDNYIMANPMQTPPAIVPEWYLLPFYAILRSIPNKLLGVIAMIAAILILLLLPVVDVSRSRGIQFRPLSKLAFFGFIANFLILMQLGAKHVESPFIEFGQISTVLYFLYFTVVMYGVSVIENTFVELNQDESTSESTDESIDEMIEESSNVYDFEKEKQEDEKYRINNILSDLKSEADNLEIGTELYYEMEWNTENIDQILSKIDNYDKVIGAAIQDAYNKAKQGLDEEARFWYGKDEISDQLKEAYKEMEDLLEYSVKELAASVKVAKGIGEDFKKA